MFLLRAFILTRDSKCKNLYDLKEWSQITFKVLKVIFLHYNTDIANIDGGWGKLGLEAETHLPTFRSALGIITQEHTYMLRKHCQLISLREGSWQK